MPPKKSHKKKPDDGEVALTRIAIINTERCKPKKCNQQCKKSCPVVKLGKLCIEVGPKSRLAYISEPLCIGKFQKHDSKYKICYTLFIPWNEEIDE